MCFINKQYGDNQKGNLCRFRIFEELVTLITGINVYFSICFVSKKMINTYLKLEIRVKNKFFSTQFVFVLAGRGY